MTLGDIVAHPPPDQLHKLMRDADEGAAVEVAIGALLRDKSGRTIPAELLLIRHAGPEGQPLAAVVCFGASRSGPDDTPRLEPGDAKFVEFAGRLGHDLNNLLSTVIGSLGLIREDGFVHSRDEGRQLADDALSASRECADLVDRLMTAAGKQFLRPQRVAANSIINRLTPLLTQTLPDNIHLQVILDPELPDLDVDPDRLEAAILDLVVNAREAMPGGGKLVISSGVGEISGARTAPASQPHYVQITVSDAGAGIPLELRNRILEPLFTTKPSGTGRGMGLSMVNGFVQQSHGLLSVDSIPGQGTSVTLNFPPAY
jgi:signal transduction histidine kinase